MIRSMVWEEFDEKPSKNGVFSKREKLKNDDPNELVISRGFALVKRGKNHVTKLGETTTISCPQRVNHGNENPSQGAPKEHEPDFDFKAPRAQGGKGLLSHEISLQTLHKSMPLILEKRGEEEEHREKRGAGGA